MLVHFAYIRVFFSYCTLYCVLVGVIKFQPASLVDKKSFSNYRQCSLSTVACIVSVYLRDMSSQFAAGLLIELPGSGGKLMKII